ncbi:unnamed protein product [Blepharisma stoltei]|uniref:Rab-GAP TBC domain-containing protein n=1 Tax=Blepharisma stoltei TaxID=1481888 RepID=A0AAU9IHR3_9CILI|nr:unnamed protein product [Blepharisma stoltei]
MDHPDIELSSYSGIKSDYTLSKYSTFSFPEPDHLKPVHYPQCSCKASQKTFSKKKLNSSSYNPDIVDSCPFAKQWTQHLNMPENGKELYTTLIQISLETPSLNSSVRQIELDANRTFPENEYFTGGDGKVVLKRLLTAFSKYNQTIGYVQGMNFIAATLLWHSNEIDAFWLFVGLTEDYDLRESFLTGFPGLAKHCHILDFLMIEQLPNLYSHFVQNGVSVQMFATDWCFTLFTSLVPIEESHWIFGKFFELKWTFFYKLVIEILDRLQEKLLSCDDVVNILTPLKPYQSSPKNWRLFVKTLQKGKEKLNWQKLAKAAEKREIDEKGVNTLLNEAYNRSSHNDTGEEYFNKPV